MGVYAICRRVCRGWVAVLCYHGVVPRMRDDRKDLFTFFVDVSQFSAQLQYICRKFTPISGSDLCEGLAGRRSWPKNPVVVTFDDGYRNNATIAAPILRQMGVPAIFHLATSYVGTHEILWTTEMRLRILDWPEPELECGFGRFSLGERQGNAKSRLAIAKQLVERCKRVPTQRRLELLDLLRSRTPAVPSLFDEQSDAFMDWHEARRLVAQGFELGSHTVSHSILTSVDGETVAAELRESRAVIEEKVGAPCRFLAYPNGGRADYSPEVMREAERAGYDAAFAVEDRHAGPVPCRWAIPRFLPHYGLPLEVFRAKVSGVYSFAGR